MATATNKTKRKTTQPTIIKVGANELGKLPPQALELEASVIGALMIEKDAFSSITDLLRPESFYSDQHRHIFEAVQALSAKDAPIDVLSVAEQLKLAGKLELAGGVLYLSDLTRE